MKSPQKTLPRSISRNGPYILVFIPNPILDYSLSQRNLGLLTFLTFVSFFASDICNCRKREKLVSVVLGLVDLSSPLTTLEYTPIIAHQ